MSNVLKRAIIAVSCVVILLTSLTPELSVQASTDSTSDITPTIATSGECGKNATWKFNEKTGVLTISGSGAMYNYTLNEDTGYSDEPWVYYRKKVKRIVISKGITRIGNYNFYTMINVSSVSIPNTVKKIGNCTFYQLSSYTATGLKTLNIPDSVTTIGTNAFMYADIKTIKIGKNVRRLGKQAFKFATVKNSKVIIKSKKIKSWGRGVFYDYSTPFKIYFPSSKYNTYKKALTKKLNAEMQYMISANTKFPSSWFEWSNDITFEKASIKEPSKVTSFKASTRKKTLIKLKWKKSNNAKGYYIYQYKNKKWKKIKTTKSTHYTVKNLTKNKKYKFKIVPYNKNSYGAKNGSSTKLTVSTKK